MMAYFRLVCNCYDDEAFKRIINYPARGIGNSTIEKIKAKAIINNLPMYQIACNPDGYGLDVKKNTAVKLKNFCNMIDNYIVMSSQMTYYGDKCRHSPIFAQLCKSNYYLIR